MVDFSATFRLLCLHLNPASMHIIHIAHVYTHMREELGRSTETEICINFFHIHLIFFHLLEKTRVFLLMELQLHIGKRKLSFSSLSPHIMKQFQSRSCQRFVGDGASFRKNTNRLH